jgi:inorganic pyrophosphatase
MMLRALLIRQRGSRLAPSCLRHFSTFRTTHRPSQDPADWGRLDFYTEGSTGAVSPWHDVELYPSGAGGIVNMVVEISSGMKPKLEMSKKLPNNPIVQDIVKKTGAPRSFTYGPIPFNYGFLPQTLEHPQLKDPWTQLLGDGDPVDVVDVTAVRPLAVGAVLSVRVLGALALVDEGECDWKILVAPLQQESGEPPVASLEAVAPQRIAEIRNWFKFYKTTDGKPVNKFHFDDVSSAASALKVVEHTHTTYLQVLRRELSSAGMWFPNDPQ